MNKLHERLNLLKDWMDRWTRVSLAGVDWGSAFLKAAELDGMNGNIILRRACVKKLEGEILTPHFIKQALLQAGITTDQVVAGLSSPEVAARSFQFPQMPRNELRNAIQLEAEQAILNGHSLNEMAIDWHSFTDPPGESIRGLLAVAPQSVLSNRLKRFKEAGLSPRIVDIEGLALWNAYWALIGRNEPAGRTVLLINIGARRTNLVIGRGRDELILLRDFSLGAEALTHASPAEWLGEIRDSLSYARSKQGLRELDHIYLTGGGSGPHAQELLTSLVSVPAALWNPLDQLTNRSSLEKSEGPLLTLAVGLALRRLG